MAQEIGVAYVSLLPSGKGFSKGVQSEAEKGFQGAEKSSKSFFSRLTGWAKTGAAVVGGMVAAVGGLAVGGGISRALNIEDATAKLKGLGNSTETVEAIMNDALKSVKGTAFGLDAAATTAASAVAAGIKPGKELERYLRLTADAATIAGTSMEDMGGIINQVTSKGYAGMENLNRLTERGIPILQWLQDEYGVTADELQDMVSRGEVDSETFRKVIEDNIGGAALASGETTRGAFANMMAALSRLGEAFVGDGLSGAKTFFEEVTIILDGLNDRLSPWVEEIQDKLGEAFQIEGMGENFLAGLDNFLENFDSTPLGLLLTALKPLIPVFERIGEELGPVLADTFTEIWKALEPMVPLITDSLIDAITELAPPFTDLLVALLPLLPPLVDLVVSILPLLIELLELLIPPIADFVENLAILMAQFSGVTDVLGGDTTLEAIGLQALNAAGPVGDFSQAVYDMYVAVSGALGALGAFWSSTWNGITSFFSTTGANIESTARRIWAAVPEEFRKGIETAVRWVQSLPGRIGAFFEGAGNWLIQSGKDLIQGFIDGIDDMLGPVGVAIGGIMDFASGFFPHSPAKRGPFSGAGWWAVADGGASLMEQFAFGAEKFAPEFSFGDLTGVLAGARVAAATPGPSELVIKDVNNQLIGRMQVEAAGLVGAYDNTANRASRGGVRF